MAQQFNPNAQNIKIRYAVLVFLKGSTAPLVLYVNEYMELYKELSEYMKSNQAVLIEKDTEGPLKKVCFISNQIAADAIQEEQYM
jgi:predicted metal-binding transcription factor (methanogenesis marker protein 9)